MPVVMAIAVRMRHLVTWCWWLSMECPANYSMDSLGSLLSIILDKNNVVIRLTSAGEAVAQKPPSFEFSGIDHSLYASKTTDSIIGGVRDHLPLFLHTKTSKATEVL